MLTLLSPLRGQALADAELGSWTRNAALCTEVERLLEQSSGLSGEAENTGQASLFRRTLLRTPRKWPWPVAALPSGEPRGRRGASQTRAARLPRSDPTGPAAQPQMPGLSGESVHMCFIPPGPD